jgi:hypothetical protein
MKKKIKFGECFLRFSTVIRLLVPYEKTYMELQFYLLPYTSHLGRWWRSKPNIKIYPTETVHEVVDWLWIGSNGETDANVQPTSSLDASSQNISLISEWKW